GTASVSPGFTRAERGRGVTSTSPAASWKTSSRASPGWTVTGELSDEYAGSDASSSCDPPGANSTYMPSGCAGSSGVANVVVEPPSGCETTTTVAPSRPSSVFASSTLPTTSPPSPATHVGPT